MLLPLLSGGKFSPGSVLCQDLCVKVSKTLSVWKDDTEGPFPFVPGGKAQ